MSDLQSKRFQAVALLATMYYVHFIDYVESSFQIGQRTRSPDCPDEDRRCIRVRIKPHEPGICVISTQLIRDLEFNGVVFLSAEPLPAEEAIEILFRIRD